MTASDAEFTDNDDERATNQTFEIGCGKNHRIVVHLAAMRQ